MLWRRFMLLGPVPFLSCFLSLPVSIARGPSTLCLNHQMQCSRNSGNILSRIAFRNSQMFRKSMVSRKFEERQPAVNLRTYAVQVSSAKTGTIFSLNSFPWESQMPGIKTWLCGLCVGIRTVDNESTLFQSIEKVVDDNVRHLAARFVLGYDSGWSQPPPVCLPAFQVITFRSHTLP